MTKDLRNTVIWMICATGIVIMAYWQAQVAVARETAERHKTLPPPVKTKRAVRPAPAVFSGDVVADYVARCEKGMTDQEIGWILEDFRNAGLDLDIIGVDHSDEEFAPRRAAQHRWYQDALIDGLRLGPIQSDQVSMNLARLFDESESNFNKAVSEGPPPSEMRGAETYARFTIAQWWLFGDGSGPLNQRNQSFMPWKLCQLAPEQEKLTWKKWVDDSGSSGKREGKNSTDEIESLLKTSSDSPLPPDLDTSSSISPLPIGASFVDWILPFPRPFVVVAGPDSKHDESKKIPLRFRILHPAQFKLLLLFHPELADQIRQTLTNESR